MNKNPFSKITNINLYGSDNKRLIGFYRDVLGMKQLPHQDESHNWYGFDAGIEFAIESDTNKDHHTFEYKKSKAQVLIQFQAESLEELEDLNKFLESKGVKLLRRSEKVSYGSVTNFTDPEGNLLEVFVPLESEDE